MDFDQIFDDVYPALYRYCMRLTADSDVAEDAAQEAFVRMLDRGIQGESSALKAWLFKVATHLIRDRARIKQNRGRLLEANPVESDGPNPPDLQLERDEQIRRVRRALEALDERDRTLLVMRGEGFRYRELADATGVKASSIGTLLARARRRFVDALDDSENGRSASRD